jgi:hypothetical protein
MNAYQRKKIREKLIEAQQKKGTMVPAEQVEAIKKAVATEVTPKNNAVKDFIESITPEQAPNAIKPSDFLPKKKKVEDK